VLGLDSLLEGINLHHADLGRTVGGPAALDVLVLDAFTVDDIERQPADAQEGSQVAAHRSGPEERDLTAGDFPKVGFSGAVVWLVMGARGLGIDGQVLDGRRRGGILLKE